MPRSPMSSRHGWSGKAWSSDRVSTVTSVPVSKRRREGAMRLQYFLPQNRRGRLPLLMWHGGGLTGVTYETTPDGREGWLTYFIRKGWDTYISDAVERGRAGWTDTFKGDALSLPLGDPWERFRIGPPGSWNDDKAKRTTYSGAQFPIEAYAQFMNL